MKSNRKVVLAIAAGLAVAGLAAYLLSTDKGKKLTKKWKEKGKKAKAEADELLRETKQKVAGMKEEFSKVKVN